MTKIVNCWNEWDPLKRVIVGRPEGTCIPAPNPGWWHDLPEAGFPLGTWGRFPDADGRGRPTSRWTTSSPSWRSAASSSTA